MPNFWLNSNDLLNSVKRRAFIPVDQRTFSDQQILDFANEEMQQNLLPMVFQFHEEYLTATALVAISSNVQSYDIPYRAVGGKLRTLDYLVADPVSSGSPTGYYNPITRVDPKDITFYNDWSSGNGGFYRQFFYLQNNSLVLGSTPTTTKDFLRVTYYQKPGLLVTDDRVGTVTALASSGDNTILSLDQIPDNITEGSLVDFLQTLPGHKTYQTDYTVPSGSVDLTSKTLTLPTSAIPSNIVVNDYICSSQEAFIPQVPDELHSILAQMTSIKCLEALGDAEGMQIAESKLQQMKSTVGSLIDNRVESEPQRIMNTNSILRRNKFFRFFRVGF